MKRITIRPVNKWLEDNGFVTMTCAQCNIMFQVHSWTGVSVRETCAMWRFKRDTVRYDVSWTSKKICKNFTSNNSWKQKKPRDMRFQKCKWSFTTLLTKTWKKGENFWKRQSSQFKIFEKFPLRRCQNGFIFLKLAADVCQLVQLVTNLVNKDVEREQICFLEKYDEI